MVGQEPTARCLPVGYRVPTLAVTYTQQTSKHPTVTPNGLTGSSQRLKVKQINIRLWKHQHVGLKMRALCQSSLALQNAIQLKIAPCRMHAVLHMLAGHHASSRYHVQT
jgi:hypothetical protein